MEYRTLLDLLSQPITDGPHETPKLQDDGIPFVSVEAIHDGIVDVSKCRGYISLEYSETCRKKYKPETDDVYMVKSASVGRVAIVGEDTTFDIWSPIAAMRPNKTIIIPRFLFYSLQTNVIQKEVVFQSSTGSQPNLSMRKLERFEIPLPPLSIQQKIVSVLDSFTTLIDKMKQEVEKRKKQMEYYREKLLTFEDGECEWKLIGSFTKVFSASRVHKNEWKNSGVPFWRSSDVMSFHNGVENSRGKAYISHELYERLSAKSGKIHKGDLLVTGGGSIGMPYLVPDDTPLYVKDADLLCIVANNVVNNKFLYKYMMSNQFREYLKRITHDASIPHYTISQIKETPVPVISLSLQEEIVSTLDKFESYITKLEKMIVLRQKQYEYYREQLLTFE